MESLLLEGKKFVKAKELARKLGYTADYVGQLCRGEKIDAKLVGRTWYVDEQALIAHKEHRQRSSKKVQQRVVEKEIESLQGEHFKPSFYRRLHPNVAYSDDTADLMPLPKKLRDNEENPPQSSVLRVELADAEVLPVSPQAGGYVFSEISRPEPIFKGDVVIKSADEEYKDTELIEKKAAPDDQSEEIAAIVSDETEYTIPIHIDAGKANKILVKPSGDSPATITVGKTINQSTSQTRVISVVSEDEEQFVPIKTSDDDVVSSEVLAKPLNPARSLKVRAKTKNSPPTTSRLAGRLAVVAALFAAVIIATLTVVVETNISASQVASLQAYEIDIEELSTEIITLINNTFSD